MSKKKHVEGSNWDLKDVIRDERQAKIGQWVQECFGPDQASSIEQRALRLMEEVVELAQVSNCNKQQLHHLIEYVYRRESGNQAQEIGGVALCLMAYGAAAELSIDACELQELNRVLSKSPEVFNVRNSEKNAAGLEAGFMGSYDQSVTPPSYYDLLEALTLLVSAKKIKNQKGKSGSMYKELRDKGWSMAFKFVTKPFERYK